MLYYFKYCICIFEQFKMGILLWHQDLQVWRICRRFTLISLTENIIEALVLVLLLCIMQFYRSTNVMHYTSFTSCVLFFFSLCILQDASAVMLLYACTDWIKSENIKVVCAPSMFYCCRYYMVVMCFVLIVSTAQVLTFLSILQI